MLGCDIENDFEWSISMIERCLRVMLSAIRVRVCPNELRREESERGFVDQVQVRAPDCRRAFLDDSDDADDLEELVDAFARQRRSWRENVVVRYRERRGGKARGSRRQFT